MQIDLSEIIKLPAEEKLRIIDELWKSLDEGSNEAYKDEGEEESTEIVAMLEERYAKIKSGEVKMYSWKEVKKRLENNAEERKKRSDNGL